jgi:hypothetical protein
MTFNSLLEGNTVGSPSTIYLIVIREINYAVQTIVVHERPTRRIVPAMAFPKQPDKLDLGDAGSLSGIEFVQELHRCARRRAEGRRGTLEDSIRINVCPSRRWWSGKGRQGNYKAHLASHKSASRA